MRHRIARILGIATISLWLAVGAAAQPGGSLSERGVLTETEAILLMPPEVVAGPVVREAHWSSDGRCVLAVRESMRLNSQFLQTLFGAARTGQPPSPPPGEISLVLWTAGERRTETVWRAPLGVGQVRRVQWLPGSSAALALVMSPGAPAPGEAKPPLRQRLLRLDGATGRIRLLAEAAEEQSLELDISPTRPLAIVRQTAYQEVRLPQPNGSTRPVLEAQTALRVVGEEGMPGSAITLPTGMKVGVVWAADGSPAISGWGPITPQNQTPAQRWFTLDTRSGRMTPLEKVPALYSEKPPAQPLSVKVSRQTLQEGGTTRSIQSLWLECPVKSEMPRALVAAEGEAGQLSPRADSVLYLSQGTCFVTQLLRVPKQVMEEARRQALKMSLMSNAKQLGLGLLMYAQDNDESLPTADGINEKLTPYLKNDRLFENFSYTYGGGPMKDIAQPAETELGFVRGPGGRAVIYADGHVRWKDDP